MDHRPQGTSGSARKSVSVVGAWLAVVLFVPAASSAAPATPSAAPRVGRMIEDVVRKHYESLHRCYRKVLARNRGLGGTVFVELELDRTERVSRAVVVRNEMKDRELSRCLIGVVRLWRFPGARQVVGVGAKVVIPLTFRPDPRQFVVQGRDAALAPLPWAARPLKGNASRLLLTRNNSGLPGLRLSLLELNDETGILSAQTPQLLYVVDGWIKGRPRRRRGKPWTRHLGLFQYLPAGSKTWVRSHARSKTEILRLELLTGRWAGHLKYCGPSCPVPSFGRLVLRARTLHWKASRLVLAIPHQRLYYVLEGKGRITGHGDKPRQLSAGSAIYLAPKTQYQLHVSSGLRVVAMEFGPRSR